MKRDKVAILTYHSIPNYGANLQAYSTYLNLEKRGYELVLLNYYPEDLEKKYNIYDIQSKVCSEFISKECKISEKLGSRKEIIDYCIRNGIGKVIIGSDAVMRITKKGFSDTRFPNSFWISSNKIKTYYLSASSMGTKFYALGIKKMLQIKKILSRSQIVTVRDRWTYYSLKVLLPSLKIKRTYDPVSLLNDVIIKKEPKELKRITKSKKYILLNLEKTKVSNEWIVELKKEINRKGYLLGEISPLNQRKKIEFDFRIPMNISPIEWYRWIQCSEGYIGELFHALISCAYNKIPFVTIDTYSHKVWKLIKFEYKSKIYDFCKTISQTKQRINSFELSYKKPREVAKILFDFRKNKSEEKIKNSQEKMRHLFETF